MNIFDENVIPTYFMWNEASKDAFNYWFTLHGDDVQLFRMAYYLAEQGEYNMFPIDENLDIEYETTNYWITDLDNEIANWFYQTDTEPATEQGDYTMLLYALVQAENGEFTEENMIDIEKDTDYFSMGCDTSDDALDYYSSAKQNYDEAMMFKYAIHQAMKGEFDGWALDEDFDIYEKIKNVYFRDFFEKDSEDYNFYQFETDLYGYQSAIYFLATQIKYSEETKEDEEMLTIKFAPKFSFTRITDTIYHIYTPKSYYQNFLTVLRQQEWIAKVLWDTDRFLIMLSGAYEYNDNIDSALQSLINYTMNTLGKDKS